MTFPALAVSAFRHARDPWPTRHAVRWGELAARLTRYDLRDDVTDKAELPAWSPCVFRDGERRGVASAVEVSALVLDYDDGTPIARARETWGRWAYALHTSWSHTDAAPRFRVVVPLATPCPAARWPRVWRWAAERAPEIDPACKDASRIYFLPAVASDLSPWHAETGDGDPLDLDPDTLPDPAPDTRARKPAPTRAARPVRTPRPATRTGRQLARMYATRRDVRERVALALGARIMGTPPRAEGIVCPSCGRPSVWFYIDPGPQSWAECDHERSCGWRGPLADLDPDTL